MSNLAAALPDAPPLPLTLLEGQCASFQLKLENIGQFDIDRVALDVQSSHSVLAKYAQERHPLVHFTGAQSSYVH